MSPEITEIYKPVDGLRYHLEQRLIQAPEEFPHDSDCVNSFNSVEKYLNCNVHNEVVTGAALAGNGLLNDHGVEHVAMVIRRASMLLNSMSNQLTGYEIYLLLLAIHMHDIGNIYGREEHETKIFEVMSKLGDHLPMDEASRKYVARIAMTHGGTINGSKDTISDLPQHDHLNGELIHPTLIAAILRFADEIADEKSRAARFLGEAGLIPKANQVYHRYSKCLQPAAIEGKSLILKYDIKKEWALEKSSKESGVGKEEFSEIFLYDEILARLRKCLCELEYCKRYFGHIISINAISASICVIIPNRLYPAYNDRIAMRLCGYPDISSSNLTSLMEQAPIAIDGSAMKKMVEENGNARI